MYFEFGIPPSKGTQLSEHKAIVQYLLNKICQNLFIEGDYRQGNYNYCRFFDANANANAVITLFFGLKKYQ